MLGESFSSYMTTAHNQKHIDELTQTDLDVQYLSSKSWQWIDPESVAEPAVFKFLQAFETMLNS
jgi:hypothetical protein